jgi:hypothetical protein
MLNDELKKQNLTYKRIKKIVITSQKKNLNLLKSTCAKPANQVTRSKRKMKKITKLNVRKNQC